MELEPPWDAVLSLAWEAFVNRSTPIGALAVESGRDEVGFDELCRRIESDTPGVVTQT